MGQLEKYGLYVLCLVIFLILGVTVWGGGDVAPPVRPKSTTASGDLSAGSRGAGGNPSPAVAGNNTAGNTPGRDNAAGAVPDLASLLRPVDPPKKLEVRPADAPQNPPAKGEVAQPKAAPAPSTPPAPPAESTRPTYKVATGDTFDSIAKSKLGSASLRTEIARLNPSVEPSRMRVDQVLILPSPAEVAAIQGTATRKAVDTTAASVKKETVRAGTAAESGSYTVGKGDTFESIARRELGSSKRVDEIRAANPEVDPTRLKIGQKIRLPKK